MGWMDRAAARAKIAVAQATDLARELDEEFSQNADYRQAKAKVSTAVQGAGALTSEVVAEIAATDSGARVGDQARRLAAKASTLPVLSALGDAARARHGVQELHARLLAAPADPLCALWLAEALDRVHTDLARYKKVRSMVGPTYALRQRVFETTLSLGAETRDPTRTRLLKSAFSRTRASLVRQPRDVRSLDVQARVYLAQGDAQSAAKLSKCALRLDPDDGIAWVTLARAYLAGGAPRSAEHAATRAVGCGLDYGYELRAQALLLQRDQGPAAEVAREYERLRSLVSARGREAYLGVAVDARSAAATVKDTQAERALDMHTWLKGTD